MTELGARPSIQGKFITFEGIDGCGKSTQAQRLAQRLRANGHAVLETREPGGSKIGGQLRAVLLNPDNHEMVPNCELLLYLADRVQHLETVIRPALKRGETVICDRFHDATVAYQQYGRGLELGALQQFLEKEVYTTPPDTTCWLALELDTALGRILERNQGGALRHESRLDDAERAFHERVREGYVAIHAAAPERVLRIEAGGDAAEIQQDIWNQLSVRYGDLNQPDSKNSKR